MKVLFVCTANIHRSRFAEEVFNFLAKERNSIHRAFSAGLRVGDYSFRTIYYPALDNLKKFNITPLRPNDHSIHIEEIDIHEYDRRICMDEGEHRSMVAANANLDDDLFEYWNIIDEPQVKSDISLPKCFQKVEDLLMNIDS